MSQLIDDLLAFSRIGRTHMSRAPIDLNALVKYVIAELQPEIRNRKVEWRLEQLPYISGDRALLHQVLTNLLANAVKYTERAPKRTCTAPTTSRARASAWQTYDASCNGMAAAPGRNRS